MREDLVRLLLRWVITSVALFVAAWLIPGIQVDSDGWWIYAVMAVILGLVNAVVKPILKFLSCPLILLTLGMFIFVVNALTLWFASWLAVNVFDVGFRIDGFFSAFLGALVVTLVSVVLGVFVPEDEDERRHRERM